MANARVLRAACLALSLAAAAARHNVDGVAFAHTSPMRVPPGPGGPCDGAIPGDWTGYEATPLNDLYRLTWTVPAVPGAWTATMEQGGGWGVGQGQFNAINSTTTIAFDSGVKLNGNVTDNCAGWWCGRGVAPTRRRR